jgi:hypothetical protein
MDKRKKKLDERAKKKTVRRVREKNLGLELQVNQLVDEHGWMVQAVYGEKPLDEWCYTVGLKHSFNHPELIIFGLPMQSAHFLLNDLAARIKNGQRFQPGDRLSGVMNADLALISVPREQYEEGYFAIARGFYGNYDFDALQVIWPDKKGLFPWDSGFDTHFNETQPVLGPAPEETRAVKLERPT